MAGLCTIGVYGGSTWTRSCAGWRPPTVVSEGVDALPADGRTALLCVERAPQACHRSLVAARVAELHGVALTHLLP